ncbi:DNA replication protein [Agrobacterium larrymoorei]|uniref:DNA replication protein n=1 Tax=Agrobacterium larrymoorei TaxID=160699 RepID=A0AAF0KIB8_9HYPH|nr:DNA replication protein [Agrobacterium larrymoorei]WHA40469.1 DNA replication protein [Agrobacterium larrymoorei]
MSVQPLSAENSEAAPPLAVLSSLASPSHSERLVCRFVRQMAFEMFVLVSGESHRRDRRHAMNHIRQISIYVCHVGLSLAVPVVAQCFGRDRSTIKATCLLVEERRENPGFDDFVSMLERLARSMFQIVKGEADVGVN